MTRRLPHSQADLLADPVRSALVRHVEQHAGITVRELQTHLGLTKSAMGYHRRILVDAGVLHERREGRQVVLSAWTSRTPTGPRLRGTTKKVAQEVMASGHEGLTAEEAGSRVGVGARTARGHLHRLAIAGLVGAVRRRPTRYQTTEALRKQFASHSD